MADISSTLRQWSATPGSNLPVGTTNIGTNLDNNLRELQAVVRKFMASPGSSMASAATVDLSTADGYYIQITVSAAAITSFGTESAGIQYLLRFAGALTLTHNATSLILPGAANITTAAGDLALMISEGSGNWRCVSYSNSSGVGFLQAGTGAVSRTVQDKLREMPASRTDFDTAVNMHAAGGGFTLTGGADLSTWAWSRKLTGPHAIGAGTFSSFTSGYHFDILTDDADVGSDFMVGFRMRHLFGGSATKGGREALSGSAWLTTATNASNANRNYVGVQGKVYAQDNDNGTNTGAGALGAIFGMGGAAYAYAAATNLLGIEGAEFNTFTETGSSAKHMAGISIVGCQATRGAVIDAGIRVGAQAAVGVFGPHIGWKWGMVFTDENGADPLYSDSTLIGTQFQTTKTILRGIDLSQFTMTEYILRGVYSKLTESQLVLGDSAGFAQVDIVGASTNSSLLLRSKGTGSVYLGASDGTYLFRADRVASSVNYIVTTPAVTTGSPGLSAVGDDTNIDLLLRGKGTGLVRFGTRTAGGDTASNGYITIKDDAGNTVKLMTTA